MPIFFVTPSLCLRITTDKCASVPADPVGLPMAAFFYSDTCPFSPGLAIHVAALEAMFPALPVAWVPVHEAGSALLTFGILALPTFVVLRHGRVLQSSSGIR